MAHHNTCCCINICFSACKDSLRLFILHPGDCWACVGRHQDVLRHLFAEHSHFETWMHGCQAQSLGGCRRMDFSLKCAYAHGTSALRTHLINLQPSQRDLTWPTFSQLRKRWAGKVGRHRRGLILCGRLLCSFSMIVPIFALASHLIMPPSADQS